MLMKKIGVVLLLVSAVTTLASCKKEESLTQAGDINLAGCEVPAGLTATQAEGVDCMPEKEAGKPVTQGAATTDDQVIKEAIARQAFVYGQSEEDVEVRRSFSADLNGDGIEDLIVVYMLNATDGGNSYATHMVAFTREGGVLKPTNSMIVAGYQEAVDELMVLDGVVNMVKLEQGPDDAACCPSVKVTVRYLVHSGKLMALSPTAWGQ
ncbi:MAG: hypothetical protein DI584_00030 [Stenotrophomonas sp.]|nr:MAG: hypothetical protein DI584_00030 [Stenotrophomonas sp.]